MAGDAIGTSVPSSICWANCGHEMVIRNSNNRKIFYKNYLFINTKTSCCWPTLIYKKYLSDFGFSNLHLMSMKSLEVGIRGFHSPSWILYLFSVTLESSRICDSPWQSTVETLPQGLPSDKRIQWVNRHTCVHLWFSCLGDLPIYAPMLSPHTVGAFILLLLWIWASRYGTTACDIPHELGSWRSITEHLSH